MNEEKLGKEVTPAICRSESIEKFEIDARGTRQNGRPLSRKSSSRLYDLPLREGEGSGIEVGVGLDAFGTGPT